MNLVKTKSFQLAIYARGSESSSKLALVLPGKLDTKDYPHMRSHVDFLAKRGYFALSFDPPGTWESPGDISLYTMTNYLQSVNELIAHFGNKPTFVMGHSRGSAIAIMAGISNKSVTSFAALMGSSSYTPREINENLEWKEKGYLLEKRDLPSDDPAIKAKGFRLPYSFWEDMQKHSNILASLERCSKPKLFIYGVGDVTVKPAVVKEAYNQAAPPKEIVALDSDHNYRIHPELIDQINKILGKFLDKYEKH